VTHPYKIVIPARYHSTRLPGKALIKIAGKTLLEHVYLRALESQAEEVIIATDHEKIKQEAESLNARVCMTSADHPSGTDRIAEVAAQENWDAETIVLNLQGDEPLIDPHLLDQMARALADDEEAAIATLATPIDSVEEVFDAAIVKVVLNAKKHALYFSRAPIPWHRDEFATSSIHMPENSTHLRHIGLYVYRASFLQHYTGLERCAIEEVESLEQLRALWHDYVIRVHVVDTPPGHGVDTEADLERVKAILESGD
jgi:3-deoxy-manno-octulosonate cytidylyltransferase (CMP-KDO synthetase)